MTCYHPLKGFQIGFHPSGKPKYKVVSYKVDHIELVGESWIECYEPFRSPFARKAVYNFIPMKCDQCFGCRLDYSREWANRMMMELNYHDTAWFVTFTYDEDHVPRSIYADFQTGEKFESLTLRYSDVQLFWKDFRYHFKKDKIKYYIAGEYGPQTNRPHYHAIIYGWHPSDLSFYKRNFEGDNLYNSPKIEEIWDRGHIVIAPVTWQTCAYTARYVMKKHKGKDKDFYAVHGLEPEASHMSTKPALGRRYYDDHKGEIYKYDHISIPTSEGGLKFRPPHYFDKLYDVDEPDHSAELKEIRKRQAEEAVKFKLEQTSLSYLDLLAVEEENAKARLNSLVREV